MTFKFSKRSLDNLVGVHKDLIRVANRALSISKIDFVITSGVRTIEEQKKLVASGASRTMRSRHLTGHAIDVAALNKGKVTWDGKYYTPIAEAMKQAAKDLGVHIKWGGDWESFKDMPHFELDREFYP